MSSHLFNAHAIYGTDNGPDCPGCGCSVYAYHVPQNKSLVRQVQAQCVSCVRISSITFVKAVEFNDVTAKGIREIHAGQAAAARNPQKHFIMAKHLEGAGWKSVKPGKGIGASSITTTGATIRPIVGGREAYLVGAVMVRPGEFSVLASPVSQGKQAAEMSMRAFQKNGR